MNDTVDGQPPALWRRLACMAYEALLLLGIVMAGGLVYGLVMQQRHALEGQRGLQALVFVLVGVYFVWCWTHGGQTLAMRTWQLRVLAAQGTPLGPSRALARYLFGWLWLLPALGVSRWLGWHTAAELTAALVAGALGYVALGRLRADRRLPHEWLSGTRLVRAGRQQVAR